MTEKNRPLRAYEILWSSGKHTIEYGHYTYSDNARFEICVKEETGAVRPVLTAQYYLILSVRELGEIQIVPLKRLVYTPEDIKALPDGTILLEKRGDSATPPDAWKVSKVDGETFMEYTGSRTDFDMGGADDVHTVLSFAPFTIIHLPSEVEDTK